MHGSITIPPTSVCINVFFSLPSAFSIGVVACAVAMGKSMREQYDTNLPACTSPKSNLPRLLPRERYSAKNTAAIMVANIIDVENLLFIAAISPFERNPAMSGRNTTESALMNATGAIIIGRAMPETLPYSAVAASSDIPLFTSSLGMAYAVKDATKDVTILVADRGRVRKVSSLNPDGFASRPPAMKYRIASTMTQIRSDIVMAREIAYAPLIDDIIPPAKIAERVILIISSKSSVDEKVRNCFLPQNQLRMDAYSVDVISVGSIMKNSGMLCGFENRNERLPPTPYNMPHMSKDEPSPIIKDALKSAFWRFVLPFAHSSAILRDSTVGAPAVSVNSIISTLRAIWYCPTISAPNVRDIHILKIKEINLVTIENIVTMPKDFAVLFIVNTMKMNNK